MKMQSQTLAIFVCLTFVTLMFVGCRAAYRPHICEPGILETLPRHAQEVCFALEKSEEFASALEAYVAKEMALRNIDAPAPGMKRTDVDHVFLRFGRRR